MREDNKAEERRGGKRGAAGRNTLNNKDTCGTKAQQHNHASV
jgi:hypothetical protein